MKNKNLWQYFISEVNVAAVGTLPVIALVLGLLAWAFSSFNAALICTSVFLFITLFLPLCHLFFQCVKNDATITFAEYINGIMYVEYKSGRKAEYSGSGTVWHKVHNNHRCGAYLESALREMWLYNKEWHGPFPTARLNKKIKDEPEQP